MMNTDIDVLVVDDFPTMRKIIMNLLKQLGFKKIKEAENGEHALSVLRADHVDFVITDWNMPKMSGIDLLKSIRADTGLKSMPV
ncbi:MAG: response regulator, partial [Deltaproteobacteria bacterium]|nr:response regulator [Deltaproteobacteria bacterium]